MPNSYGQYEYNQMGAPVSKDETWGRQQTQAAWASLRMVREAIEELFGPIASVSSEEGVVCITHGPELHHEAEALIEALQRVKAYQDQFTFDGAHGEYDGPMFKPKS